jgi:predicted RecB family nuclease
VVHLLSEHPLPGIDPRRQRRLAEAGLDSIEALVEAGVERVAKVTGFDRKTTSALVRVAEAALSKDSGNGVITFQPSNDEPASERLGRGLKAARHVERAVSLVRKADSHAQPEPKKESWAEAHRKAKKQLQKLLETFAGLQQQVLSDGLSHTSYEHLKTVLGRLEDSLSVPLEEPIRKRSLERFARTAKRTRKEFDRPIRKGG